MIQIILTLLFSALPFTARGTLVHCLPNQEIRMYANGSYHCVGRLPQSLSTDCIMCQQNNPYLNPYNNWFQTFPSALYQPQPLPWWAHQGNLFYPNLHYPGVWSYPGIKANHYSGTGPVFAAKPNVYVKSIHQEKPFELSFEAADELSFLALTPYFQAEKTWKGKIRKDLFEVEGIFYDYLFYDIRMSKEHMQFEHGVCTTRENGIRWMLEDLRDLAYSDLALQDFEEHWHVKIPEYPFYCIYPQYNKQLEATLPMRFALEQTSFIRSLYILVPHKSAPRTDEPQRVPLPFREHESLRPEVKIIRENMFREWGVAFLENPDEA